MGHNELALVGAGVTAVGLGVFIGFGLAAQRADENVASVADAIRQEIEKQQLDRTNVCASPVPTSFEKACNVLSDNMDARDLDRTLSTIGLVTAGISAAATVTAYFVSTPNKSNPRQGRAQIAPLAGPHQAGLTILGTF
jgi:hypothetical protein